MPKTKLEVNGQTYSLECDDKELHAQLVRQVIEQTTAAAGALQGAASVADPRATVAITDKEGQRFMQRCKRYESSQLAVLKCLLKNGGKATKDQLIAALGTGKNGTNLAGCRGSMSKNARACGFPRDWWTDRVVSRDKDDKEIRETALHPAISKMLAKLLI